MSWTAPASDGGSAITGYCDSSPGGLTAVQRSATYDTVTGLTNGTAYRFTVVAANVGGTGPASAFDHSDPAPAARVADRSAAPRATERDRVVDGARLQRRQRDHRLHVTSSPGGVTRTVGGERASASVTGLTNGATYAFTVVGD